MEAKELAEVLAKHKAWWNNEAGGVRAYLRGADLRGAYLQGATINWQSHTLLSEILRREAGTDVPRRMLAGLIAISLDWCWDKFLVIEHPERAWAIAELATWVKEGDGAPDVLRAAAKGVV